MNEFFKESEFEKQFPLLAQLPLDALPLPGFDRGEFWRSFKFPTKTNREPDLNQIKPNATLFVCEEVESKKYQYVIGTLVSMKKHRFTLRPLYRKKTTYNERSKEDGATIKWLPVENESDIKMNFFFHCIYHNFKTD